MFLKPQETEDRKQKEPWCLRGLIIYLATHLIYNRLYIVKKGKNNDR